MLGIALALTVRHEPAWVRELETGVLGIAQRALAYEAKGDFDRAKQDYAATLEGKASDAGSKANQATAKVRLSLLSEAVAPPRSSSPRRRATRTPT